MSCFKKTTLYTYIYIFIIIFPTAGRYILIYRWHADDITAADRDLDGRSYVLLGWDSSMRRKIYA
jgi:hypothetical protein